jgi:hypothetical protein
MQVYFRASADAYVLLYNIDTEGYIHLIYPFRPRDPSRVEGGQTYQVPARHDPYELVAEGPAGVEYVVALASPLPFQTLPWYLAPGAGDEPRDSTADGDDLDEGVIVGDPYVGMEKLNERIVPAGREDQVATADTYFYIERHVEYPRYVCADCHHRTYWFDPYVNGCSVIDIRIDATWARYGRLRVGSARPRYYYHIRPNAPDRYRVWKQRWSSLDGTGTLRGKFVLERERTAKQITPRRTNPPEFRDLRRYRPGRFWQGRDQILKLREARERVQQDKARDRSQVRERDQARDPNQARDERRNRREAQPPPEARKPDAGRDREVKEREQSRDKSADEARERRDNGSSEKRNAGERRSEPPPKGRDRGDRSGRGR